MIIETLGIQPEHRVCLRGITNPVFAAMVLRRTDYPPAKAVSGRFDVIVHQVDAPDALDEIASLARHLEPAGMLWVLHPSGEDALPSVSDVRSASIAAGLVPTKRCIYSVTHFATRFSPQARVVRGTI
jgi:hypothetical protein